ncbi:Xaa-Pro aminopeptidase [Aliiglaciecola sp. 3_MG-2023]|uniref:Xaa-Pro aminopeptidase n=1 Tax=Aliiglaciecola sp. 3_MG-2023 TaxID=3062644 RepID=UPI0026E1BDEB|nr:Xaa-Pro aminopeptidase [Aliiglaciecola sp. 3_MG-2023]MDO6694990.1 Xaa-Pro aminopeptidase [Aliiglaciecola sp. 3_MG-2023]
MSSELIKECTKRRQILRDKMRPNSIAVIPAANLLTRSNDTEFPFRQDSDFHYLSAFPEPDGYLVISNSPLMGDVFSALFCLPKDELAEIWQGRRIGVEAAPEDYAVDIAHPIDDIDVGLVSYINGHENLYFARGHHGPSDVLIDDVLSKLRNAPKQSKIAPSCEFDIRTLLHEMRLFKSDFELSIMAQAANISADAHVAAMKFSEVGKNEFHLEATIHHHFAMQGAKSPAYSTIVGSGENACILHYTENNCELQDNTLVLIDAGAELQGYAADITRTFPVNGRFTEPQKALYQLVLDAQLASFALFKPGSTFKAASDKAIEVLTAGLIELGLLSGELEDNIEQQHYRQFFMHGLGHWLGLDVHDVGNYKVAGADREFEPGMVLTVEPGLYVSATAEVDPKWKGIGIRIEDNIVITEGGYRVLTDRVPKTIADIESLMAN